MAKGTKIKAMSQVVVKQPACSSAATMMSDLEYDITVQSSGVCKSCNNHNLQQNGTGQRMMVKEGFAAEEKWAKHYSSYHKILLVGEGDFSFSASLAVLLSSASNLTATSLHSKKVLRKEYEKAVHNIEDLKRKGCKVIFGVDATAMASHPSFKFLTFDRIIFNFPYAPTPKNGSRKAQLWRHQSLVRGYLKSGMEMVGENGEIHITHRVDGGFDAWRIDFIASQLGLELIEAVDFSICDFPGYNPKWGKGSDDSSVEWFPSKTYKFRHPRPPLGNLSFFATHPETASNSPNESFSGCQILELDEEELIESFGLDEEHISSPPPSNCYLKQNDAVSAEQWVKFYSNSHKMLLVGEGDFSFSASLASAFGSANNMFATSLDSEKFVGENYGEAVLNIEELKRRGCTVIFGVDATRMAHHPCLMGLTFDYIIFNFPFAFILESDSRNDILWRHQSLVRGFLRNAKQMIGENGEIHITHRTDGVYSSWRIKFIASQLGLELAEAVDFNICDYPGYNVQWETGSDSGFGISPSKTYKFRIPPHSDPEDDSEESCDEHSETESETEETPSCNFLMHNEEVKNDIMEEKWAKHYSSRHKILLVGEGDFSFSSSLAATFGSAANMIATSLNTLEFLKTNYCLALLHLKELKRRGCKVIHGVDATCMANHPCLKGFKFDRIIFNFPFAGFFKNQPRRCQIRCHQNLVSEFLGNAKQMIGEGGEIHIAHKTNGFHGEWDIVSIADKQGLELEDSVAFKVSDYPGYCNKYGFGGDRSFPFIPSETFMFRLPPTIL